jgi:NADH-quinone oxidoreductase subunit E
VARLSGAILERARQTISLYPQSRSALIPLCHLAQEQDGWLTPEAMEHIAELLGLTPVEVLGTASFYDMLHTEPVGRNLVGICTNIACLLGGAYELVEHAEEALGIGLGGTTEDGRFSLEEMECIALCDQAPCLQVNYRYFGSMTHDDFDRLVEDLRGGQRSSEIPPHGTLSRVHRQGGLRVPAQEIADQRAAADRARQQRAEEAKAASAPAEPERTDRAVAAQPGGQPAPEGGTTPDAGSRPGSQS